MKKYQKCIDRVTASMAEGKITPKQAEEILRIVNDGVLKIGAERIARLSAKETARLEHSIHDIADFISKSGEMDAAIDKRAKLMDIRARRNMVNEIMRDMKQMPGKGFELYFEKAMGAIRQTQKHFDNKFATMLEASGLDLSFVHRLEGKDKLDLYDELRNLSMSKPASGGVTGNVNARKLAEIYMQINDEVLAFNNRNGGHTDRAEGRTMLQTHSVNSIRRAGIGGLERANMSKSYQAWRDFLSGLKINWNKMGVDDPAEREKWLRVFHTNIYTREFSKEQDLSSIMRTGNAQSLADRHAAERKLWFEDSASEIAYAERFGSGETVLEQMVGQLQSTSRNGAMLQYFGVNAQKNVDAAIAYVTERNKHLDDSTKRLNSMDRVDAMWAEVTGKSHQSSRPNVSRFVDGVKNMAMLAKAANLIFSTPPDLALAASSMTYRGVGALDAIGMDVISMMKRSDNARRVAAINEDVCAAFIRSSAGAYANDMGRDAWGSKTLSRVFKWTGFNMRNDMVRHAAGEAYGKLLGREAGNKWGDMDGIAQRDLKMYGIGETEWNVWRKYTETVDDAFGTHTFLSAGAIDRFTDSELDSILTKRGDSLTPVNRTRLRDRLRSDALSLFDDVIEDAATGPTVRGGAFMRRGLERGGLGREAGELLFMLKSFGINSVLNTIERERKRTGTTSLLDWARSDGYGMKWHLIGQAVGMSVAGYLVVALSDLRKGQTPSPLLLDGKIQWDTVFSAIARGGSAGMLSDFALSDYDKRYRDFLSALAGPVIGEASNVADIISSLKSGTFADEEGEREAEYRSTGYQMTKLARNNIPLANLFFVKPVLDHLFWYQLSEGFAPGSAARNAATNERRGRTYWNEFQDPREAVSADPLGIRD